MLSHRDRGKTVGHQVQGDAVPQAGLEPGQHQGETFGGVYHPRDDLFRGADETAVADADEGPGAGQFLEQPLHLGRIAVAIRPFDEDAAVRLQVFHFDFLGNPVHVPVPAQPFPGFEAGIAAAEPEPGGDGRIDEGFEDLGDGAADQHFRLGDDLCDGSHGKSSMGRAGSGRRIGRPLVASGSGRVFLVQSVEDRRRLHIQRAAVVLRAEMHLEGA